MSDYEREWRAFENNEVTHSTAHYLLAVAGFEKNSQAPRAADVARQLDVSRAAVSLQLRALREHGLVEVSENNRLSLTPLGAELVARIASKREVMKVFLHEVLGVSDVTAERDACKIEHLISEETGAGLVRFIHFLRSEDKIANDFLQRFEEATAHCPPGAHCGLCNEVCLLNLADQAESADPPPAG
ncbi:MAG: metal-dependent transcriptional regulator [Thermoanaerobaculales bacterium]